jgi:hypothetical protein
MLNVVLGMSVPTDVDEAVEQVRDVRADADDRIAASRELRQRAREMQVRIEEMRLRIDQAQHFRPVD